MCQLIFVICCPILQYLVQCFDHQLGRLRAIFHVAFHLLLRRCFVSVDHFLQVLPQLIEGSAHSQSCLLYDLAHEVIVTTEKFEEAGEAGRVGLDYKFVQDWQNERVLLCQFQRGCHIWYVPFNLTKFEVDLKISCNFFDGLVCVIRRWLSWCLIFVFHYIKVQLIIDHMESPDLISVLC